MKTPEQWEDELAAAAAQLDEALEGADLDVAEQRIEALEGELEQVGIQLRAAEAYNATIREASRHVCVRWCQINSRPLLDAVRKLAEAAGYRHDWPDLWMDEGDT